MSALPALGKVVFTTRGHVIALEPWDKGMGRSATLQVSRQSRFALPIWARFDRSRHCTSRRKWADKQTRSGNRILVEAA